MDRNMVPPPFGGFNQPTQNQVKLGFEALYDSDPVVNSNPVAGGRFEIPVNHISSPFDQFKPNNFNFFNNNNHNDNFANSSFNNFTNGFFNNNQPNNNHNISNNNNGKSNGLSLSNNFLVNNIKKNIEKGLDNLGNLGIFKSAGIMNILFQDALDNIVKSNRIENYDDRHDFRKIQQNYSIRRRFEDDAFRPSDSSIYYTERFRSSIQSSYNRGPILWKRAKDLAQNAQFAMNDNTGEALRFPSQINQSNYRKFFNTTDLDQGSLGNCWFISGATGIIQNFTLFQRVVPFDNSFDDSVYTGAFHFRFWIYGTWKDVVIDDYLPVDPSGRLIFSKNRDTPNEFWCALLEKAYAKICGSYETLDGGFTSDALIDMSGGIEETFELRDLRSQFSRYHSTTDKSKLTYDSLWNILIAARKKSSVLGCNIEVPHGGVPEGRLRNGLVQGHAYILTKAAEININGRDVRLVRLYNPWGNEVEWNGEWSDRSSSWSSITPEIKERLELKIEHDGEFWMSYDDWVKNFDNCQICNLTPDSIGDLSTGAINNSAMLSNIFSMWQCQMFHGKWIRGVSAGGCGQYDQDKYWTNPQYSFAINDGDSSWIIIGLMQKNTRQKRMKLKLDSAEEFIQYRLYKVKNPDTFNRNMSSGHAFGKFDLERIDSSGAYINKREVTCRFSLKSGQYILIPSCYDEDAEGEFLIRIFTEKPLSKNECKHLNSSNLKESVSGVRGTHNQNSHFARDFSSLSIDVPDDLQKTIYKNINPIINNGGFEHGNSKK